MRTIHDDSIDSGDSSEYYEEEASGYTYSSDSEGSAADHT